MQAARCDPDMREREFLLHYSAARRETDLDVPSTYLRNLHIKIPVFR